jgi:hypothetical protein
MTHGIVDILINDSTVQTLVGLNEEEDKYKVFALVVPQKETAPYIACKMTSRPPIDSKSERASFFSPTVAVFCYATNYKDCLDLERAVKNALDGTSGTHNGVHFNKIRYADSSEDFINTDGNGLYVRIPSFTCFENESDPT